MKQIIIIFFFLQFQFTLGQDINFLVDQNGFRDIKLGTNINDYDDFLKKDMSNEEYFGLSGSSYDYIYVGKKYDKIDETDIFRIFVNTIDDLIYEIEIVTQKDYKLWSFIENAYGKPTVNVTGLKGWYTDKIRCRIYGETDTYKNYYLKYEDVVLTDLYYKRKTASEKEKAKKQF